VSKIRIRKLKKGDAEGISRIDAAITKTRSTLDYNRIVDEEVRRSGDASFVAEQDDKVVGYMISYISSGNFGIDKSAWIAMFGVDPKFMGQGIGRSLAEKIFKVYRGKGITHVFTSVSWDSTDLLSFFKTIGFDRSDFINLRKILD
jgi:ribosomal protein S18 acetylase RimI-like enzyme